MIVKLQIKTDNVSGLKILDMDDYMDRPVRTEDLEGIQCVKADGLYFKLAENHKGRLAEVLTDDCIITEFEALGLKRMMEKYITPNCEVQL